MQETKPGKAILLDFTECIGCGACEQACAKEHGLPADPPEDRLSHKNYTVVLENKGQHYRKMCMHCLVPTCVSVCPVGALEKTDEGPVVYHPDRCIGCRYCMMACPFQIPKYEWEKPVPVIRKCIMCNERVKEGGETACSWVCPTGACRFGSREKLLAIAHRRIKAFPDRYVDYIYGETEVGGTGVLMMSGVPFADLGFPEDLGTKPLSELTWTVMSKIPNIVITGGLLLGGISWIIHRRMDIEKENLISPARNGQLNIKPVEQLDKEIVKGEEQSGKEG
ncbi:4Fe-4S dicluster domain-containing protein [bacterium]|nr:4Fe-4S dicluster domain-containing protein [bacterium]